MKSVIFLLVVATAVWGYSHFLGAKTYPPGILIKSDPDQVMISNAEDPIQLGKFTLKKLATYTLDARVLHTKRYRSGEIAGFAPYDVAVGWGPMSDQAVLDQLTISQGNRFYFWEYTGRPPISKEDIIFHSANMHLIPASSSVRWQIAWLRRGELVRLQGFLVEVNSPGMPTWRSSLSRTDTGKGACEIMWVESLEKIGASSARPPETGSGGR